MLPQGGVISGGRRHNAGVRITFNPSRRARDMHARPAGSKVLWTAGRLGMPHPGQRAEFPVYGRRLSCWGVIWSAVSSRETTSSQRFSGSLFPAASFK